MAHLKRTRFTPTLTAGAYSANDVLFATMELPNILEPGTSGRIVSLNVLDKDDQGVQMELYFLKSNVALGTLNGAVSISDANAEEITCVVEIDDYVDLINSQYGTGESINGLHQGLHSASWPMIYTDTSAGTSVWVAGVTRGTPTHTASGLIFEIWVDVHN